MRDDFRKHVLASAVAALMIAGASCQCGPDTGVTDSGARPDSGVVVNPGTDAGQEVRDSGATGDAGTVTDAGRTVDAGVFDAGCQGFAKADGGCAPLLFSNICELPRVTVVHDSDPVDDSAGSLMGLAVAVACPGLTRRTLNWRDGGVIDDQGAPLLPANDALVCGGGSFAQRHVGWLENAGGSAVSDSSTATQVSLSLRDGRVVASDTAANITPSHDYFVIQLVHPNGGLPVSVIGYGFLGGGTTASAWYFGNVLMPARASLDAGWYVGEWRDGDSSGSPNNANEFTLLGSGR